MDTLIEILEEIMRTFLRHAQAIFDAHLCLMVRELVVRHVSPQNIFFSAGSVFWSDSGT